MSAFSTLDASLGADELRQIDAICDRFEDELRAGERPKLGSFLEEAPVGARAALFRDLFNIELDHREQAGEPCAVQAYTAQFPDLRGVIEVIVARRAHRQLAHGQGRSLARPSDLTVASPTALPFATDSSPWADFTMVAPNNGHALPGYEIIGELGRGGMGVVFRAYQTALNRPVALKWIKSGRFATDAELRRFQNEAEAVAQLDHPNIVPIYEVGEHARRHFFSMKLIAGSSLDQRIAEFTPLPRSAAALVATIAEAIHHAHQRGILHRDLKPANILLDEDGQPHITDFGLAKRITGDDDLTLSGSPVGTPAYMSPEQASGAKGAVSTATDVYGIGSILYALLSGRAPFSGTTLIDTLDQVRTCSPEPPSQLNNRVPRDLEIICLKCLEKDPNHRYASALAVAEDLKRWLAGMPIAARPVGRLNRALLWCRRNKAFAALLALLLTSIVGGVAGVTWKWREADRERIKTEAVNELLIRRLLAQASLEHDPLAKNLTVRELLDRAAGQLGGWLEGQPEIEARIRETIGGAYLSLDQFDRAEAQLRAALEFDTRHLGTRHRDTLRVGSLLATLLDQTNRRQEALKIARRIVVDSRAVLGSRDPVTLDAAERLGAILWHVGASEEAEAVLRQNVDLRAIALGYEHPDTLRSVYLLSRLLLDRKKHPEADQFAYRFAHSVQCARGSNHPDNVLALTNRGEIMRDQGKLAEAEPFYRLAAVEAERIFGHGHRRTIAAVDRYEQIKRERSAGARVP
jgi:tetratricopeptide (TPR) repeat protein